MEFGRLSLSARAAEERVTRLATRLADRAAKPADRAVNAIDEAFADFTQSNPRVSRVDRPEPVANSAALPKTCSTNAALELESRTIITELNAQLVALDQQRERLVQLLQSVDAGV
jgi:hypothetical protein